MIVLDSQTIDLSDLFGENNGLHDVDDKEEGIARSMTMARSSLRAFAKILQTAVWRLFKSGLYIRRSERN